MPSKNELSSRITALEANVERAVGLLERLVVARAGDPPVIYFTEHQDPDECPTIYLNGKRGQMKVDGRWYNIDPGEPEPRPSSIGYGPGRPTTSRSKRPVGSVSHDVGCEFRPDLRRVVEGADHSPEGIQSLRDALEIGILRGERDWLKRELAKARAERP